MKFASTLFPVLMTMQNIHKSTVISRLSTGTPCIPAHQALLVLSNFKSGNFFPPRYMVYLLSVIKAHATGLVKHCNMTKNLFHLYPFASTSITGFVRFKITANGICETKS